jgi:hypothetical protein
MELNPLTALLLEHIGTNTAINSKQHLENIIDEINLPDSESIVSGGKQILEDLHQRDVLLIKN